MTGKKKLTREKDIKIVADKYRSYIKDMCIDMVVAGSIRREVDTPGDIDILVIPHPVKWSLTRLPYDEWLWGGEKKIGIFYGGFHIDIMLTTGKCWGAALLHFTGSQMFNIKMRKLAAAMGYKLNEYGLSDVRDGFPVASISEEDIFKALKLKFIPPRMRTDSVRLSEWAVSHSQNKNRKITERC